MKSLLLAFSLFTSSVLAQSSVPTPKDIQEGYLDSLYKILLKNVKDDNFAVAKVVAAEIDRVSGLNLSKSDIAPCGFWLWHNGSWAALYPGGSSLNGGTKGTWKWIDQNQHKLQIKWQNGYIDDLVLSEDAMEMQCTNDQGGKFVATRLMVPEVEQGAAANP